MALRSFHIPGRITGLVTLLWRVKDSRRAEGYTFASTCALPSSALKTVCDVFLPVLLHKCTLGKTDSSEVFSPEGVHRSHPDVCLFVFFVLPKINNNKKKTKMQRGALKMTVLEVRPCDGTAFTFLRPLRFHSL